MFENPETITLGDVERYLTERELEVRLARYAPIPQGARKWAVTLVSRAEYTAVCGTDASLAKALCIAIARHEQQGPFAKTSLEGAFHVAQIQDDIVPAGREMEEREQSGKPLWVPPGAKE